MKNYYVIINGQRKGPFPEAKVRAGLRSGQLQEDAEIYDAQTGDIVLAFDILEGGEQAAVPQGAQPQGMRPPQGGVNYGREQDHSDPSQKRGQGSMYTQNAMQQSAQWNQGQPYGQQYEPPPKTGMNPGILPFIVAWVCWPIGMIGGIIALRRARENGQTEGWAWAAITISIIGILGSCVRVSTLS